MATARSFSWLTFATRPVSLRAVLLRATLLCLVAYCVVGAALAVVDSAKLLPNQYDNSYPESSNLFAAVEGARTGHIYLPLHSSPYVVQPYGPVFYLLNMGIARAAHLSLDRTQIEIRSLAYVSYLLCGLVAFLLLRKLEVPVFAAVLAGLALLAQPYFIAWNATVRPDLLCLLLMLLCLYFAVGDEPPSVAACCLSGFFGALAFLMKQPGIAAPLAVAAVLLYRRQFRRTLVLILSAAVPVLLVFALLLVRHEPFWDQFTSVGEGFWSLAMGLRFVVYTLDIRVIVSLGIGALALSRAFRAGRGSSMIAAFALLALLFAFAGMPQAGSDVNYYLPPLAGCALLLPFCIEEVQRRSGHPLVLAVAIFGLLGSLSVGAGKENRLAHLRSPQQPHALEALRPFHILSDRPSFAIHGRDPELLDPFTVHGLEVTGHWDSVPIVEHVRHDDYDLIVMFCMGLDGEICNFRGLAWFSPAVVQAVNENYVILCSTLSSRVLVPRFRKVDATPQMLAPALAQPCGAALQGKPPGLLFPSNSR